MKPDIKKGTGPFAYIVIFTSKDKCPWNTIARTCSVNKVNLSIRTTEAEDTKFKCEIYINEELLSTAVDETRKTSKFSACALGLETLTKSCYTVEMKCNFISGGPVITRETNPSQPSQNTTTIDLPADNIGTKIMRLMGWSGNQGLGKDNQGIEKPIKAQHIVKRTGFGHLGGELRKKFTDMFKEFVQSDTNNDLVFSSDFTSEERAVLHVVARQFKLQSKSYGKGDKRHLVVSKVRCGNGDVWKLVEELLLANGETEKYRLIEPSCLIK